MSRTQTDFFTTYQKDGIFDDAFIEAAKKDAKEYQNVVFSLAALYAGDEEPVTVVQGKQLCMIQNEAGVYLFGEEESLTDSEWGSHVCAANPAA